MSCAELEDLISAYADGQTVPAQSEFIESHLSVCARCQDTLRRHQQTRRLLRLAGDDAWVPPDLRLRVAHAYRRRQGRGTARRGMLAAGMGMALLLMAVLGAQMLAVHGGAPASLSAGLPSAAAHPGATVAAPVRIAAAPSADSSRCRGLPRNTMASCLGVSRYWLPTVIAEETSLGAPPHAPAIQPLHASGERSVAPVAGKPAWKGGGANRVTNVTHISPQPV